jgi:dCMP deaminase
MRPEWDDYFLEIAEVVKQRATCIRRKVGCLIVQDKRILATGYNGAPQNISHCDEGTCIRIKMNVPSGERHELCRGLHAEQNAIIQAAKHGINIGGSTLYCTTQPCAICAKMIINANIKRIVYKGDYPDDLSKEILEESGVSICIID